MSGQIAAIFRKELLDIVRDRKSLMMLVMVILLSGPLVLGILFTMINLSLERQSTISIAVVNPQAAPDLTVFLKRQGVTVDTAPADFMTQQKAGKLPIVLEIPPDFAALFATGQPAPIRLIADYSDHGNSSRLMTLQQLLNQYQQQVTTARMVLQGVSPALAWPIVIQQIDLATPQQSGSGILSVLAFYALYGLFFCAMGAALDATAGERERLSLEPLLGNPIRPLQIAIGKWLAVGTVNVVVACASLLGYMITLKLAPLPNVGIPFLFDWREFGGFLLVLAPFALFVAATLLAFGALGKSVKESQTAMSLAIAVVALLPLLNMFAKEKLPDWMTWVPVNGQYYALEKLLRGEMLTFAQWLPLYVVPLSGAALMVWLLSRQLGSEKLLAG
ncbi:sodium transport system permease protein [Chitinivorax tropicus]|uniref:Sodium transport system permease protein n=1 Tax=Chitinivorax tropicus TaxID=714531 RepID=A0A840MUJ5_9PROT|nr:ABC transporter permease [Chitinivorax tropicus]MBB5020036.1 sodium transport system permease protein [Chitinivorax tropicus]